MLHSKSKIRHMLAGRELPSIDEPMRVIMRKGKLAAILAARTDFVYGVNWPLVCCNEDYVSGWQVERMDWMEASR